MLPTCRVSQWLASSSCEYVRALPGSAVAIKSKRSASGAAAAPNEGMSFQTTCARCAASTVHATAVSAC
ncbi:MAG: hypothetical protein KatS3mg024_0030 [Armatimonadota bacterium]|nr:MAG: hypothetical protein KatS3mg024_0030 [Armatimonadota bacterium]